MPFEHQVAFKMRPAYYTEICQVALRGGFFDEQTETIIRDEKAAKKAEAEKFILDRNWLWWCFEASRFNEETGNRYRCRFRGYCR